MIPFGKLSYFFMKPISHELLENVSGDAIMRYLSFAVKRAFGIDQTQLTLRR